jgi:UDP-glucose 4-epimerase
LTIRPEIEGRAAMSILVTGGGGYIGSHMVWELVERGETVTVLDDLSTGFDWAVAPAAELVIGDIGDRVLLDRLMQTRKIDTVMHFAGSVVVPESVADPLGYYLNNTVKSREVVAAAVANGVENFVFSSTAAVYGVPAQVPVTEDAPLNPMSPYGASKAMTERMLTDASAAYGLRSVALRYFNVAGADPAGRTGQSTRGATHLLKVAIEAATGQREHVAVFGTDYDTPDGTGIRDFIHVSDLARAHSAALDYLRGGGESLALNCGYGRGYSVLELLDAVQSVSGRTLDIRARARRAGDIPVMVAAADAIRARLGWEPRYDDLHMIVQHALAWERKLIRERIAA